MDSAAFLVVDTERFPHDTVEGETVVIDSVNGHLFLFTGLGPWLWKRMMSGGTIEAVIDEVKLRYGDGAVETTHEFLVALVDAEMLHRVNQTDVVASDQQLIFPDTFIAPRLEKYDDIADIIAMDPIHDVDPNAGWPRRQESSDKNAL